MCVLKQVINETLTASQREKMCGLSESIKKGFVLVKRPSQRFKLPHLEQLKPNHPQDWA